MEHVVFYPDADGTEAFRRAADLEEAVRLVERLRNDLGVGDASVFALHPVPLAFRTYVHVELPVGESTATEPAEISEAVDAEPVDAETVETQTGEAEVVDADAAVEADAVLEADTEAEAEVAPVEADAELSDAAALESELLKPEAQLAEPSIPPPPSERPAEFQRHLENQPEAEVDVDTEVAVEPLPSLAADFFEPIEEFEPTQYADDAPSDVAVEVGDESSDADDAASAFDAAEWETAAQEPQDHADHDHEHADHEHEHADHEGAEFSLVEDNPDQLELLETAEPGDLPTDAESADLEVAEVAEVEVVAEAAASESEVAEAEHAEEHAPIAAVEAELAEPAFSHEAAQQQVSELAALAEYAGQAEFDALPGTADDVVASVEVAEQVAPDGDIAVTPYRSSPAELPPLTLAPGPLLFDGDDQPIVGSGSYDAVEEAPAELTDLIPANFTDLIPKDIVHGSLHSDAEAQAHLPEQPLVEAPVAELVPEAPVEAPVAELVPEAPVEAPVAELVPEAPVEAPVAELPPFEGDPAPSTDELPPMDVPEVPSDVSGIELLDAAEIPAARENAETTVPQAGAHNAPRGLGYFGG